jgi:C1A family cysteine protease
MRSRALFILAWGGLLLAGARYGQAQAPADKSVAATKAKATATMRPALATEVLRQNVASYAQREQTATPAVKSQIASLRQQIKAKGYTFEVGYTTALDVPLNILAATRIPANLKEIAPHSTEVGRQLLKIDLAERARIQRVDPRLVLPDLLVSCNSKARAFDWRSLKKVTPVKSQICGTCWDFTSMGAYEGSYAIRNNQLIDTSEEYILECAHAGSCAGGWWMPVFNFMISNGTATEAAVPFTGAEGSCPTGVVLPYRATAWGFVKPDGGIPTVADMKQALCDHGPLAVAVEATGAFAGYTGGVFNEHDTIHGINHGVTLIGWDDTKNAWIIKNSWGPGWGSNAGFGAATQKGYMYIAYDSNNIGYAAAWVQAQSQRYRLPIDWSKYLERERIFVKPLPDPERLKVRQQP